MNREHPWWEAGSITLLGRALGMLADAGEYLCCVGALPQG